MLANGYPVVYCPNSSHANPSGYVYEHMLVAEEYLQRPLKPGEVVHHKDKNRLNNKPSNLMVFASNSDHVSYHNYGCDDKYIIEQEDGAFRFNDFMRKSRCSYCGGKKEWDAIACRICYDKYILPTKRKTTWPSREELKNIIKNMSFNAIGKLYGVSDNTVRRWCRIYNIPYHRKEIDSIPDKEWGLL